MRTATRLLAVDRRRLGATNSLSTTVDANLDTTVQNVEGIGVNAAVQVYGGASLDSVASGAWGAVENYGSQAASSLSADAQQWYAQHSSTQAQTQAVVNGAVAATKLAQNGFYNCHGSATARWNCEFQTGAEVIAVYAGALTVALGPVGAAIGAIAEAVYAIAHEILAWANVPLEPICTGPTPPWTYGDVLNVSAVNLSPPAGSLPTVALPVFGSIVAQFVNCKAEGAAGLGLAYTHVLPGVIQLWNSMTLGKTIDYYVPRMAIDRSHSGFVNQPPPNHPPPSYLVGADTAIFSNLAAAPYAFMPLSQVPEMDPKTGLVIRMAADEGKDWLRVKANAGPVIPGGATTKTALAVAAVPAVAAVGSIVYSLASGKAWDFALQNAWKGAKAVFK